VTGVTETDNPRIVRVSLKERSYDIVLGQSLLESAGSQISDWVQQRYGAPGTCAFVITDTNVARHADVVARSLQGLGWRIGRFEMPAGEASKRLELISAAWDRMVELPADRRTVVVAVGGGVVGDAAGFVAATFSRGVPFVQVPTSLLADVDSSVGGKVGINHPRAKNLLGAFHQPLGVLIDTDVLATLPDREFRSGLAEVAKYGVILDAAFFEFLERESQQVVDREPASLIPTIARSCELKAQVVEADEFEQTGLRAVLNYGHTFAHAFEALCGYGELLHGEAVSIGMVYASRLAEKLGRIGGELTQRQLNLLSGWRLPIALPNPGRISAQAILDRMQLDKKTLGGQLRFVLPTRLGHVELVTNVPVTQVLAVLKEAGHP
jgi:3-dehydroquinate synthase